MESEAANDGQDTPAPPTERVELQTFSDLSLAELTKASLEAQDIACWLNTDDGGGMCPSLQLAQGVKLLVAREQLAEARQILEAKNLLTPEELERLATQSMPEEPKTPGSKLSLAQIAAGIVVGVLLCLLFQATARVGTKTYRYDSNGDGKTDELWVYRNGVCVEQSYDRNFDRKYDQWFYYDSAGKRILTATDDNFDGVADVRWYYTNGVLASSTADTDFNGTPDVFNTFKDELLLQSDWRPNGTNIVTLRQFFRHEVLTEERRDTNMDGAFDVTVYYDAFQNPSGTNVFKLTLPVPGAAP
jgi:hypothetical protein